MRTNDWPSSLVAFPAPPPNHRHPAATARLSLTPRGRGGAHFDRPGACSGAVSRPHASGNRAAVATPMRRRVTSRPLHACPVRMGIGLDDRRPLAAASESCRSRRGVVVFARTTRDPWQDHASPPCRRTFFADTVRSDHAGAARARYAAAALRSRGGAGCGAGLQSRRSETRSMSRRRLLE